MQNLDFQETLFQGTFVDQADLLAHYPNGHTPADEWIGYNAILESTDTFWIYSTTLGVWRDSGSPSVIPLHNQTNNIYVDGTRTDPYTETGDFLYPFKTFLAAINAVKTYYTAAADKQTTCYDIYIFPGTYTDAVTINTVKHLRIHGTGVKLSGAILIDQSPIGGSGEEPYTRIEFIANEGWRGEKGQALEISGNITIQRTNDSLSYFAFKGCRVSGNVLCDVDGTFVIQNINSRFSGTIGTGTFTDPDSAILLESDQFARFSGTISGKTSLYNCNNTDFSGAINITPIFECRITNCKFSSSISIIASKNLNIDSISKKAILDRTPTLTGMTVIMLDELDIQTHTVGATVTILNNKSCLFVNPAIQLAALTITMPAAPYNGQEIKINFGGTITNGIVVNVLSIVGNAGQTILAGSTITSAVAGDGYILKYDLTNTLWRIF